MQEKIHALVILAKTYMAKSQDPIHDSAHVERVAAYAQRIAKGYDLSEKETQALTLAVWWHDTSRSIFPSTSLVWMYFFDDLLSALMLWFWTVRYGLFGSVAGVATRIIFCKSQTLGAVFVRLFLTKRSRLLLRILEDADALDMLHVERLNTLCTMMSAASTRHQIAYKLVSHWWTMKDRMQLYTAEAKAIVKELVKALIAWVHSSQVIQTHEHLFGAAWTQRFVKRWERITYELAAN
jgi:hypothetical protein